MLILAGVSINAIIGDDGIISRTQYSTFLSEMTAVEEAVQMWKAGEAIGQMGEDTKAIPANGLCTENDLSSTERLSGEVGYYRIWSMTEKIPETSVLSNAIDFNNEFESELIAFPAGVQDLFYLNNEILGIESNKTYVIDIATGMIYSMSGIKLKGISCYSSNMATAVMSGTASAPMFAESEVSGTGTDDKLAGNQDAQYGFQIFASPGSNNIFKLYNNGDLYGKGVKGPQLNTSKKDMDNINPNIWNELQKPNNIGTIVKTIVCTSNIFYINDKDEVYVIGDNTSNKLGLNEEQMKEYTTREAIKLDLKGMKVRNIFSTTNTTFIVSDEGELYACGNNSSSELGLEKKTNPSTFEKVSTFTKGSSIVQVDSTENGTLIQCSDNTFYFSGLNSYGFLSTGKKGEQFDKFVQVYDGNIGEDIDQDIAMWSGGINVTVVKKDGTAWTCGFENLNAKQYVSSGSPYGFRQLTRISRCYKFLSSFNGTQCFLTKDNSNNVSCYIVGYKRNTAGSDFNGKCYTELAVLPEELVKSGIKDVMTSNGQFFFISNSGKLYGTGAYSNLGMNKTSGNTKSIEYIEKNNVNSFANESLIYNHVNGVCYVFINCNDRIETTGNQALMYGNNILQSRWKKIASDVKYFHANASAYITKDGNLYVAGSSAGLGLGELSEQDIIIPQYIKCEDENLVGKCKKVEIVRNCIYVLTTDDKLYAAGKYEPNGGPDNTPNFAGWNDGESKYNFFELLDGVSDIIGNESGSYATKLAIMKDESCRVWGSNFGGTVGCTANGRTTPYAFNLPYKIGGVDNIEKIILPCSFRSFIITKDHKVFIGGNWRQGKSGGNTVSSDFVEYTYGLDLADDEYVIDVACQSEDNTVFLTNKGRLFAYGYSNAIGIGNNTTNYCNTREVFNSEKVIQISAGSGFFIAVTENGKVYATGSNIYGVLGRWIGIGRGDSNSRYKTALNWVECPELEL